MIDIRDNRLFINDRLVGDENRILDLLSTEKKYKAVKKTIFKGGDDQ